MCLTFRATVCNICFYYIIKKADVNRQNDGNQSRFLCNLTTASVRKRAVSNANGCRKIVFSRNIGIRAVCIGFCIARMPKACFFFRISAESERRQKNLLISLFMALLLKLFVVQYQ
jgi:hypothetical protein